jgi:hypothetical protein
MIKQLINEIALDNIKLSQALTKTKLIVNKIQNHTLKIWLKKELTGYDFEDQYLPKYRKIYSEIILNHVLPGGQTQIMTIQIPTDVNESETEFLKIHLILESISLIEIQLSEINNEPKMVNLPHSFVDYLMPFISNKQKAQLKLYGGSVNAFRRVNPLQYENVIEQTKQNLLDTLIEIDNEFPNLEDEYKVSNENSNKLQNIITNNIYGGNAPINIAAGESVHQTVSSTINFIEQKTDELKEFGVEENEINDLKEIISKSADKSSNLSKNLLGWLGKVSASVTAKGLYEHIPQITEFIKNLI